MAKALSIRNLTKTYATGLAALRGIDLDVEEGDFFALLGPNGAGKSTTIGIVASLITKTSGTVSIFGTDLDADPAQAKAHLGLVPQEFNFNQFEPVVEILINQAGYYGLHRTDARLRAETYLKQLGLWEKRGAMARSLSGGMKRRLMIARALVHQPRLLILDEPTAGVDIEIRHSMWRFLREINASGTTIILTTHYLEEAENLCRNIAIIDHGILVENTNMKRLLAKLQMEIFVLDLAEPLTSLPPLPGHDIKLVDEHTIEAVVSKEKNINSLFTDLGARDINVVSMRNKTNRLEQLFMHLVEGSPGREAGVA